MPNHPVPDNNQEKTIAKLLIKEGEKQLTKPPEYMAFSNSEPGDTYLNGIINYPHHFFLGYFILRRSKMELS